MDDKEAAKWLISRFGIQCNTRLIDKDREAIQHLIGDAFLLASCGKFVQRFEVRSVESWDWHYSPCCQVPGSWRLPVLRKGVYISEKSVCPSCQSHIWLLSCSENDTPFYAVLRHPVLLSYPSNCWIFGRQTSPSVFVDVGHLIVVRGVECVRVNDEIQFVYSVCEDGYYCNYFYREYDEAIKEFNDHVEAVRKATSRQCWLSRVGSQIDQPFRLTLIDFAELLKLLGSWGFYSATGWHGDSLVLLIISRLSPLRMPNVAHELLARAIEAERAGQFNLFRWYEEHVLPSDVGGTVITTQPEPIRSAPTVVVSERPHFRSFHV